MLRKSLLIGALALAGCASTGIRQSYADYAGPSIKEFKYSTLYNWQRASDRTVVVWTRPTEAYLLTMSHDCIGLDGRVTIQMGDIDGIPGRLQAGSGKILVGNMRCTIIGIQPVDLLRMRKERQS